MKKFKFITPIILNYGPVLIETGRVIGTSRRGMTIAAVSI
jgi:hypothetical protein